MIEPIELPDVEWIVQDNIFIKQMLLARAGTFVPQHSHKYSHASMLASGSVRVWKDDVLHGDFKAPIPISIDAGCKHTFMSLEPNTVIYCIHRVGESGEPDIEDHAVKVSESIIEEGVTCLGQQQQQ